MTGRAGTVRRGALPALACLLAAGPAAATEPSAPAPDGRYAIDFHGFRFALLPWGGAKPSVSLCFAGQPSVFPYGEAWDRRIYWPLSRILEDPEGFRREAAQAKSITADQEIPTTAVEGRSGERPPAPVLANSARMFTTIDVSGPRDQPCSGSGKTGLFANDDTEVETARSTFERKDWHEGQTLEHIGPLAVYRRDGDRNFASGKIERQDRGFPASGPLYVWCSWPSCRRYAENVDLSVQTTFDFTTGPDTVDPAAWARLDRYFHAATGEVFLGRVPDGLD